MAELELVRALLAGPTPPAISSPATLKEWLLQAPANSIDRAALGGLGASGVGWAFACGYEAALGWLDPEATRGGALAALCATEEGGGHPRAIRTSLAPAPTGGHVLSGRKSWVTLGAHAEALLVVATTGLDARGRNRLRVARIPSTRSGVSLEPGGSTPFAPEITHARARFEQVAVDETELLAGDGYDTVLKPFRTIEDAHVTAAVVGWATGIARANGWEHGWMEEAAALLVTLRVVGGAPPSRSETHLLLAGALTASRRLLDAAPWSHAPEAVRVAWQRDRPLLDVASAVRAARLAAAWQDLTGGES
jgi:hypothetical protein